MHNYENITTAKWRQIIFEGSSRGIISSSPAACVCCIHSKLRMYKWWCTSLYQANVQRNFFFFFFGVVDSCITPLHTQSLWRNAVYSFYGQNGNWTDHKNKLAFFLKSTPLLWLLCYIHVAEHSIVQLNHFIRDSDERQLNIKDIIHPCG